MITPRLLSGCGLLAVIISVAACNGPSTDPGQHPDQSGTITSEGASRSPSSGPTSAGSAADPVATNDLILVDFPAAEGPPNHDGAFTAFDYESQIGFKNPKDEPITIRNVEVVNVTGAAFSLGIDGCSGRTLSKESVCVVRVQLEPPTPPGRSVAYTGQLILHMPAHNTYQVLELSAEPVATLSSSPPASSPPASPPKATPSPTLPSSPRSSSPVP